MTAQIVAYTLNHFGSLCVCSYRNGFACEKYRPFDKETGQPKDRSAMSIFWQRTHKALFQFINIISFNRWYRKTRAVPATRPPRHVLSSHLSTVSFFGVVIENHANISTTDLCTRHNIHVRIVRRKTHSHHIRLFDWTWFRIAVDQFTWNSLNLMEHCLCRWLSYFIRTIPYHYTNHPTANRNIASPIWTHQFTTQAKVKLFIC